MHHGWLPFRAVLSVLVLWTFFHCVPAYADWSEAGAQYSCNRRTSSFTLLPHDKTNGSLNAPLEHGFKAVGSDRFLDGWVRCDLGPYEVEAKIGVYPPSNGMCMGGGSVRIQSIRVTDTPIELLPQSLYFNLVCGDSNPPVVKIVITTQKPLVNIEQCFGKADGTPNEIQRCETKTFNVDRPLGNEAEGISQEELVHKCEGPIRSSKFTSTKVRMIIRGGMADRVFLSTEMPSGCVVEACGASSYIVGGDSVEVGYACGPWAAVRYTSKKRHQFYGWVDAKVLDFSSVARTDANMAEIIPNWIRGTSLDFNDAIREAAVRRLQVFFTSNGSDGAGVEYVEAHLDELLPALDSPVTAKSIERVLGGKSTGDSYLPCFMSDVARQKIVAALKQIEGGARAAGNLEKCSSSSAESKRTSGSN